MWLLVKTLPNEIQLIFCQLQDIGFYKVFDIKNRYIGNAKKYDIEKYFTKKDGNVWGKKELKKN